MKNTLMLVFGTVFLLPLFGQQKEGIVNYVSQYKDVAIEEMVRTGIPASITLAQGILESGCGQSDLSLKANNHFGIKCKDEWNGKRFYQDDDAPNECFRVYANARESYADHSDFLLTRSRYADLFKLPEGDYKSWAYGLKAAGYATNPQYAPKLINYIETYSLHQYDEIGYAMIQKREILLTTQAENAAVEIVSTEASTPFKTSTTKEKNKATPDEFIVNGIRAIKAEGSEDPFAIAFEYNIDYAHVLSFNDLNSGEKFKDGENIFLQPKRNKAEQNIYRVQEGESVRDISQKFGVKLKDLCYKNLLKPNEQVMAGESIYLQDKRSTAPKTITYSEYLKTLDRPNFTKQNGKSSETSIINKGAYEVQQKDTLYSIAKKFNTTVDKIKEINNMDDSSIRPGQTLVVSQ